MIILLLLLLVLLTALILIISLAVGVGGIFGIIILADFALFVFIIAKAFSKKK